MDGFPAYPSPAAAEDGADIASEEIFGPAFTLSLPQDPAAPLILASPHSGTLYPDCMQSALALPLIEVRRTEDAFVDELFSSGPDYGATLIAARFARSVADLNRDPSELDPQMFLDGTPRLCGAITTRVEAGLGCLPRVGARGEPLYGRLLTRAEGEARLAGIHDAYHRKLAALVENVRHTAGRVLLIDCHSMPSAQPGRRHLADIVLGDRFGSSCDAKLLARIERAFRASGLTVARNTPYAGGYTTRRYGRPKRGMHALQIEVNRGLYMDETAIRRGSGFLPLKAIIASVLQEAAAAARQLPLP